MKHNWTLIKLRFQDAYRCLNCGQEWPEEEIELFKKIDSMPCPNFIGEIGDYTIEYISPSYHMGQDDLWIPYEAGITNIREAIDFCSDQFDGYRLRLYDRLTKSTIEF